MNASCASNCDGRFPFLIFPVFNICGRIKKAPNCLKSIVVKKNCKHDQKISKKIMTNLNCLIWKIDHRTVLVDHFFHSLNLF